jgi:anti-sigma regulatory factor (Ser/Thr protein kinase)
MQSLRRDGTLAAIPIDSSEASIPSGPLAPSAARNCLTGWFSGQVPDGCLNDARLLVSELVTNSVLHAAPVADATVHVKASLARGILRLEVGDTGNRGTVRRRAPDRETGGGFGLNLVDVVAARWGVDRGEGTHVWAELRY